MVGTATRFVIGCRGLNLRSSQEDILKTSRITRIHGAIQLAYIFCAPFQTAQPFPALITLVPGLVSNAPSARRRNPPRFWQTINVSSGHATVDCHPNVFMLHTSYNSLLCVPAVQCKSHGMEENPGSPKHYKSDLGQAFWKSE
jgi:hypothetical protein